MKPYKALLLLSLIPCLTGYSYTSESLAPAQKNGNPSLELGVSFGLNPYVAPVQSLCQATLVQIRKINKRWRCSLLTAAHCVWGSRGTASFFETTNFGSISKFQLHIKGDYYSSDANDLALVHFFQGCKSEHKKFVVPIGKLPRKPVSAAGLPIPIYAASRAFTTLFPSFLPPNYQVNKKTLQFGMGTATVQGKKQTLSSYSGDSGGGLFIENKKTRALEIVGVLSSGIHYLGRGRQKNREISQEEGSQESIYVLDLDWVYEKITPTSVLSSIGVKRSKERIKQILSPKANSKFLFY